MNMRELSNYDKHPFTRVSTSSSDCQVGWLEILRRLRPLTTARRCLLCIECYPGVFVDAVRAAVVEGLKPRRVFDTRDFFKDAQTINDLLEHDLSDDPVFGRLTSFTIDDFLDTEKCSQARERIHGVDKGLILVIGNGAVRVAQAPDVLVYADMARWEIQQRQREGETGNLGVNNAQETASGKYKRGFFVDWRAADRLKKEIFTKIDYLLDTNDRHTPKLISGENLRRGLEMTVSRPFRVVPFFDPGPWGGQWMKKICNLPSDAPNYAWCFDCVPEENSLLLGFGSVRVEIPSIDLVFSHPRELLGEAVHARFGSEFPIRFDFLDTMDGGNLSLQVHPLTEYIQDVFGMHYTQDESYYVLDAKEDAVVYLGLKEGISPEAMIADLKRARDELWKFPDEKYVNKWPAKPHDHFLIPAGTVHCSGGNSMVLEISATPYIFTFKMWDWNRLGLDGEARPIHIHHAEPNIQWNWTTEWVRSNLINQVKPVASGRGWREEKTGLHEREFIETRRHWFTGPVNHHTQGGVNVLNLVQGEEAVVESPHGTFDPLVVHYAETFIVPAAVGPYTIRPIRLHQGANSATIKAFVGTNP